MRLSHSRSSVAASHLMPLRPSQSHRTATTRFGNSATPTVETLCGLMQCALIRPILKSVMPKSDSGSHLCTRSQSQSVPGREFRLKRSRHEMVGEQLQCRRLPKERFRYIKATSSIPWQAYESYHQSQSQSQSSVLTVLQIVKKFRRSRDGSCATMLLRALEATRDFFATDFWGKFYAILPVLGSCGFPDILKPDYGVSVEELYIRVASYFIAEAGLQWILEISICRSDKLPSWVPDWTLSSKGPKPFTCKDWNRTLTAGGSARYVQNTHFLKDPSYPQLRL
jgi:hypothetical protein